MHDVRFCDPWLYEMREPLLIAAEILGVALVVLAVVTLLARHRGPSVRKH